jgi:hypothetical protein
LLAAFGWGGLSGSFLRALLGLLRPVLLQIAHTLVLHRERIAQMSRKQKSRRVAIAQLARLPKNIQGYQLYFLR